jgi:hypothetical protein
MSAANVVAKVRREHFDRFIEHCRKMVPNFTIIDGKRDSYLMNLLDGIVYPFNKRFMDGYITTIGGRVYFPDGNINRSPLGAMEVAAHEFVHAYDVKRFTLVLFTLIYLSFLSFAIFGILAFGIFVSWVGFLPVASLAIHSVAVAINKDIRRYTGFPLLVIGCLFSVGLSVWFVGWQTLWLLAALIFVAPIPAPGRKWAEMRGYGMSIFVEIALFGLTEITRKAKQFTGPDYYFMWPFKKAVRDELMMWEIRSRGGLIKGKEFAHVHKFFEEEELLLSQQRRTI